MTLSKDHKAKIILLLRAEYVKTILFTLVHESTFPGRFYCETDRWYMYKHFSKAPFNTGIENPVLGKIGKD